MTDDEILQASKFSLLPLCLDQLPSENVLLSTRDPFCVGSLTVWTDDDDNFALSGSKACKEQKVAYELFETYDELVAAVAADQL